jgi:hypothetical protein
MFHPLRALRQKVEADDARMRAAGFDVLETGALSRTYKLSPEVVAARRREAENEHVRAMAARSRELYAIAFPDEHAELQWRTTALASPAPVAALSLEELASALAARIGIPDRVVFERLTIERHQRNEVEP